MEFRSSIAALALLATCLTQPAQAQFSARTGYEYEHGDLKAVTYHSGLVVTYKRVKGRVVGIDVQVPGRKAPTPFVTDLSQTPLKQPAKWTWWNGDTASRSFNLDGRLTSTEFSSYEYDAAGRIVGVRQDLWATRSVTSGTTTVAELYKYPVHWSAGYDARHRLTRFSRTGAESTFSYDPNGNRLLAVETQSSDVDLDAAFDQPGFTQSTTRSSNIDGGSNRQLGFTQTLVRTRNGKPVSTSTASTRYTLDANGALVSDGIRTFEYDDTNALAQVVIAKDGEAARIRYLHNYLGQRVFRSEPEPEPEETLPNETTLANGFVNWLRKNFGWLFVKGPTRGIGQAFVYADGLLPQWALLGEYDTGSAQGRGVTEYIWLPIMNGDPIPIGMYRNGKLYAVHADHLGTPRLITDADNKPVWQWPYSAFGNNKPTGVLAITTIDGQSIVRATKPPVEYNLRFPGQYWDEESNLAYNFRRWYRPLDGRYTQFDPIGLRGGPNGFNYARQDPLRRVDPSGLFDFAGHVWITTQAVGSDPAFKDLPMATALVDFQPGSQRPENAYWHAMSDGSNGQTAGEARQLHREYVEQHLAQCTLAGLARALHAVQDGFARGHRGFQPWSGGSPGASHIAGDVVASPETYDRAVQASRELIDEYKVKCQCSQ
ncbi:RHS repeat-associated core domain-containing protein [Ramlibacter albus]|uniref:RHS repeat-associated core domain-containing protein n=1 Tax=Ramlibacter albus TaxID=2079448 RepID=A0A923S145_9BURK|nr:RHS repeat-associated core domain-containing protein [Ramlibacter albus]MBC5763896.1 hypothetical protein [Ramlibacter albus]